MTDDHAAPLADKGHDGHTQAPAMARAGATPSPSAQPGSDRPTGAATQQDDRAERPVRQTSHQSGKAKKAAADDDGALPSTLLVRHRMGFTVVTLSNYQKTHYGRDSLEDFMLYKEQKYNAVNKLSRFVLLFVFFLVVNTFCVAFCMSSPNWHLVRYRQYSGAIGLFTACTERNFAQCTNRVSARWERALTDSVTGVEVCAVRGAFLRNYIGAMWSLAILQLLGITLLLLLAAWISLRPTRSRALIAAVLISLLCMLCNIINCVLFSVYVRCDRKTCQAQHLTSNFCETSYMWGYKLYIACAALHAVVFLVAVSMYTFIQHIDVTTRLQLRRERSLRARQEFLNDYIRNLVETMTPEQLTARSSGVPSLDASTGVAPRSAEGGPQFTQEAGVFIDSPDAERVRRHAVVPAEIHPEIERDADGGTRMHLHVRFQRRDDMAGRAHNASASSKGLRQTPGGMPSTNASPGPHVLETSPVCRGTGQGSDGRDPGAVRSFSAPTSMAPSRANSILVTHQRRRPPAQHPHPRFTNTAATDSRVAETDNVTGAGSEVSAAARAPQDDKKKPNRAFKSMRKRRAQLMSLLGRREDGGHITADELGIRIAGAQDWVYDDKSDMYYSYELNMFWDPITHEYFNCALQSWQEEPHQVVEIRDAFDLAKNIPFLNDLDSA